MDKKKRKKKNWNKGQSMLSMVLAFLMVTGSLNLSGALEVHAENSSETFIDGSTENVLEPVTEPVIAMPDFTDGLEAAEAQQEAMSTAEASAKSLKIITA